MALTVRQRLERMKDGVLQIIGLYRTCLIFHDYVQDKVERCCHDLATEDPEDDFAYHNSMAEFSSLRIEVYSDYLAEIDERIHTIDYEEINKPIDLSDPWYDPIEGPLIRQANTVYYGTEYEQYDSKYHIDQQSQAIATASLLVTSVCMNISIRAVLTMFFLMGVIAAEVRTPKPIPQAASQSGTVTEWPGDDDLPGALPEEIPSALPRRIRKALQRAEFITSTLRSHSYLVPYGTTELKFEYVMNQHSWTQARKIEDALFPESKTESIDHGIARVFVPGSLLGWYEAAEHKQDCSSYRDNAREWDSSPDASKDKVVMTGFHRGTIRCDIDLEIFGLLNTTLTFAPMSYADGTAQNDTSANTAASNLVNADVFLGTTPFPPISDYDWLLFAACSHSPDRLYSPATTSTSNLVNAYVFVDTEPFPTISEDDWLLFAACFEGPDRFYSLWPPAA